MKRKALLLISLVLIVFMVLSTVSSAIGSVQVKSLTMSKTSLTLNVGATGVLAAKVLPANATNKNVTWSSSSAAVAKVSASGVVTGVKAGTATITATSKGNSKIKTICKVTVVSVGRQIVGNVYKTGLPIVKTPVTVKFVTQIQPTDTSPELKFHYKNFESVSNVNIEWTYILNSAWLEKKNLIIASGDLPDAFVGMNILTDYDVLNFGSQGIIIPLEKLIQDYNPNLVKAFKEYPDLMGMIKADDGHIYSLPSFDEGVVTTTDSPTYINKTWLDKLGLKVPTTTDELYTVLKAFKEKDPNGNGKADEIPFTFTAPRLQSDWFGAFGVLDDPKPASSISHIMLNDSGKVVYSPIQQGYKDAIKYFNRLYTEKLLDQECYTQSAATFGAKWQAATRIVGMFQTWRTNRAKDYVPIPPVKGPAGTVIWPEYPTGLMGRGNFAITAASKNKEVCMRFADYMMEDDLALQQCFGYYIGFSWLKTADGKIKNDKVRGSDTAFEADKTIGLSKFYFVTKSNGSRVVDRPAHMIEKGEADAMYSPFYAKKQQYPNVLFSLYESNALTAYRTDINPYVAEQTSKWIMKGGIDAEWDAYVSKLKDMKLDKLINVYQTALNRYNAKK